ncbi:MAG: histidine phosphatase family protein [Caulobacterales bacterium]
MHLDVMRHGATASTLGHRFNDHEHEPLAEEALAALARVAFDASRYDRIDVSSLRRAVQTAEGLGLASFNLDPRLAERGLGLFRGLTESQCRERFGADYDAFCAFEADYCIPGGESRGAHLARVLSWLEDVAASGATRALAITHGGVIDFLRRLGRTEPIHGGPFNGGELLGLSRFEVVWPEVRLISFSESPARVRR